MGDIIVSPSNAQSLVQFEQAKQLLALCTSLDEVKQIRDQAEALRVYHRQAADSLVMQNQCAEIKARAERRAGEILVENGFGHHGGDRKSSRTMQLDDYGINKTQSSRWQKLASIPEETFNGHIEKQKKLGKEITTSGLLKVAKVQHATQTSEPELNDFSQAASLDSLIGQGQRFACIYADPPWKYGNQGTRASTDNHYPTMTIDDICNLPVMDLAEENSHLHLWVTKDFLAEGLRVLEAWGFEYKSMFVWCKTQMGIGNYWRVSHELLLLGCRGKLPFNNRSQKSWVELPRTKHSEKPQEIREKIELVSPGPRLELFARKQMPGWTVWGNQIESTLFANKGQ